LEKYSLDAAKDAEFQAGEAALTQAAQAEKRGDLDGAFRSLAEAEAAFNRAKDNAKRAWQ